MMKITGADAPVLCAEDLEDPLRIGNSRSQGGGHTPDRILLI